LRSLSFRPAATIETFSSDRIAVSVADVLVDATRSHELTLDAEADWDGDRWEGILTYENRQLLPAIFLQGGGGERRTVVNGDPLDETTKRGSASFRLPFRAGSYFTWFALEGGLSHVRTDRSGTLLPQVDDRETLGFLRLSREVNRPRRSTLLALRYERSVPIFSPTIHPERVEADALFRQAVFRNDGYLTLSASGGVETGSGKRVSLLLPANVESPRNAATGTRTLAWGTTFSYPWSEDLHLPLGPFTLERLTHRLLFREGRAWDDDDRESTVRSLGTEIEIHVFSSRFIPFLGAGEGSLRAGIVQELDEDASPEFYIAVDSEIWNEKWSRDVSLAPSFH
jgi:hypothetical protein